MSSEEAAAGIEIGTAKLRSCAKGPNVRGRNGTRPQDMCAGPESGGEVHEVHDLARFM